MSRKYARFIWRISPSAQLGQTVNAMGNNLDDYVDHEMHAAGKQVLSWMKANHAWQNRTGAAEARLIVEDIPKGFRLAHGVPYGVYLEFKHGGRWGVMRPAMVYAENVAEAAMHRALMRTMGSR
jgi:hypothetical protein